MDTEGIKGEPKEAVNKPRSELLAEWGRKGGIAERKEKTIVVVLEKLLKPSLEYLEDVALGREEKPSAVRLNACKTVIMAMARIQKEGSGSTVKKGAGGSEQLGNAYEEGIKNKHKEELDAEGDGEGVTEGSEEEVSR